MAKYVAYIENENDELLKINPDGYVHECESWPDVLALFNEYLAEDAEFYEWGDATLKKMVAELVKDDTVDMLNGRFFYVIPWDGEKDAIEVAIEHSKAQKTV